MKERGILFKAEMVRATIEHRKKQTRRLQGLDEINLCPLDWKFEWADCIKNIWTFNQISTISEQSLKDRDFNQVQLKCPYGVVRDQLWVRETFNYYSCDCHEPCSHSGWVYRADEKHYNDDKWKPSLFMPRAASRITLEITDIRVERLNEISEADAIAEGVEKWPDGNFKAYGKHAGKYERAVDSYASLWESINGDGSWSKNPYCWVVEFKMI